MNIVPITLIIIILIVLLVKGKPIVYGFFSKAIQPNSEQYPFHANILQLLILNNNKKILHSFCGGSLIHPQWILTAAHCIRFDNESSSLKLNETYVALGSIYRNGTGGQIHNVDKLIINNNYLKDDEKYDIGLIKLSQPTIISKNINIIRLHLNNKENLLGKTAYLTGFGVINDLYKPTNRLRKAILHISNYNKCHGLEENKKIELCGTSTIAEGKACKGDSGGPLFIIDNNNNFTQIGITSHLAILPLCRINFNNSVYTRVSAYILWISKVTGINFYKYNQ